MVEGRRGARRRVGRALGAVATVVGLVAGSLAALATVAPPAAAADPYLPPAFGDTYVAAPGSNAVFHFPHYQPLGGVGGLPPLLGTVGTGLLRPAGVAVSRTGHVYIADTGNRRVLDVAPDGTQTTIGSGFVAPRSVAVDGAGNVFVADPSSKRVSKITPAGAQTVIARGDTNPNDGFDSPTSVAVTAAGTAYILARTTTSTTILLEVTPAGVKTKLHELALFLEGVSVDRAGNVFFTEAQQKVQKLPADRSAVTTVFTKAANADPAVVDTAVDGDGNLLVSNENTGYIRKLLVNRVPATEQAWLNDGSVDSPSGIAIDEWLPAFPTTPPPAPNPITGVAYTYADGFPALPSWVGFATTIGVAAGDLPPGLRLARRSPGFALTGTPTAAGTFTFTPVIRNAVDEVVGDPITVTVDDPHAPDAPTIGTATAGNASAKVTWTAPASNGGSAVTGYTVTASVAGVAKVVRSFASTATSQTVTGLTNGTAYTFTVKATNALGTGAPSAASNAVVPSGSWFLRNANSSGGSIGGFTYGSPGDVPVVGDWDGNGTTTIGVFRPSTATWYLRNANSGGGSIGGFGFGSPGDVPVVGDWDGNGTTTIGVFRPSTHTWYLRNANSSGGSIGGFAYGSAGDVPVVGDWDGNGTTTIGVFRPSTTTWYLRNANSGGASIGGFAYGTAGDRPIVGDWDGNGTTTVGTFRPTTAGWFLRNANSAGASIGGFGFGSPGDQPVVGDWDGNATTTIGVFR